MKISPYREEMREIFKQYMNSSEWREVRKKVGEKAKFKCKVCKKKNKNGTAHHTSYVHWGKANFEEVDSCIWVCTGKCHMRQDHSHTPFFANRKENAYAIEEKDFEEIAAIWDGI